MPLVDLDEVFQHIASKILETPEQRNKLLIYRHQLEQQGASPDHQSAEGSGEGMSAAESARINGRVAEAVDRIWERHFGVPFDNKPFG